MKKAYIKTWIFSITTFLLSFIIGNAMAKKYGESPNLYNKFTLSKFYKYLYDGCNLVLEKLNNK